MKNSEKFIVISGATKGLGLAMVKGLANQGYTIWGCGRSEKGIAQLRATFPGPHRWEQVDISQYEQVQAWANSSLKEMGSPDYLINNAAVINSPAPTWEVEEKVWKEVMDVNVLGTAWMIKAWVPAMVQANKGIIVNFSSTWGRTTSPEVAPYCASKFAIEGMTQALSQELPKTMAAVALNPGIIHTDMLAKCFGENAKSYQNPEAWAAKAIPLLLKLGPAQNGKSISVA